MKIGFPTALFLVFLVLKLTGVIAWSWWLITAPLWLVFALVILIIGVACYTYANETPEQRCARKRREWMHGPE